MQGRAEGARSVRVMAAGWPAAVRPCSGHGSGKHVHLVQARATRETNDAICAINRRRTSSEVRSHRPAPSPDLRTFEPRRARPLQRLRGGLWQGRCCSLYGMVRGRLRRPRWRWEGRRRWQRGTGREEMPADVALSVHIIGQYRSTCATSNENHQNQVQVLKVNCFGSWGTDPRRFCS